MQKRSKILIAAIALLMIATVSYSIFFFGFHLPKKKLEADRARQVLEYYQSKLTLYKAENERFADYEVDVAFLGDSLTDGEAMWEYDYGYQTIEMIRNTVDMYQLTVEGLGRGLKKLVSAR